MESPFLRTEMLLGPAAMARLADSHVAVFGLGGVGSWCAEALCRSGVGALTLVDRDTVGSAISTVRPSHCGPRWASARPTRWLNGWRTSTPPAGSPPWPAGTRPRPATRFLPREYDYIVDAIDLVSCKLDLIETALTRGIPILSSLGTGNKLDPSRFRISDLSKTEGCPLARVVRKELRARGIVHHRVLWSPEEPCTPAQPEAPPPGRRSVPGSVAWVPPVAGMMLAGEVVMALTGLHDADR